MSRGATVGALATEKDPVSFLADYLDRLITVEMRNGSLPTGKIGPLYDAARAEAGGTSLVMRAALALCGAVHPGDRVFIVTGAGAPPLLPQGENDGPPDAAAIARAIYLGLHAIPVYVSQAHHLGPILAASEAAAVAVRSYEVAT